MAYDIKSIYEEIKEDIISLKLLPGTKIKEEDLANKYKISRTPIRSVISRLVKDELLDVIPQKGTYVSKIDINNIKDYLYIRKSVEASVIKEVADRINEDELNNLKIILDEQKEISLMEPSIEKSIKFYDNDNAFHIALYKIAKKDSLWKVVYDSTTPLNRARIISNLRDTNDVEKVYDDHYNVYINLKNKKTKEAIDSMIKHLDEGFSGVDKVINEYNTFFKVNDNE